VQKQVGYNPKTGTVTPPAPTPPPPTPEQKEKEWIKEMTPGSDKDGLLIGWWSGFTGLNTSGSYWQPTIDGVGHLCFGLLGCKKAMDYLQDHGAPKRTSPRPRR
jgi:hypothetical protein